MNLPKYRFFLSSLLSRAICDLADEILLDRIHIMDYGSMEKKMALSVFPYQALDDLRYAQEFVPEYTLFGYRYFRSIFRHLCIFKN